jgi:vacuolar iron transporter family protein
MLALERRELAESPQAEVAELAQVYGSRGLQAGLARHVAERLTVRDALVAQAEAELGIDPEQLAHPGHTAGASLLSFMAGAVLPLLAITLVPGPTRTAVTIIAVLAALVATGALSAAPGRAPLRPAVVRNIVGGAIAMSVTHGIGTLIGAAGI